MKIFFLGSLLLGSIVVFQPMLNRMVLEDRGLSFAVWLNGCVLFLAASLLFFSVFLAPERFSEVLHFKGSGGFHWWYVLPGILGLILVLMVPVMFKNMGAFPTIIAMLCGQILTSFLVDSLAFGVPISASKIMGLLLATGGAYLSFNPNS